MSRNERLIADYTIFIKRFIPANTDINIRRNKFYNTDVENRELSLLSMQLDVIDHRKRQT
jgi:hypothetical protein